MKVSNKVKNQFIISDAIIKHPENDLVTISGEMFQSYSSNIAFIPAGFTSLVFLDEHYWDYSRTTGKYRNQFLGESKAETQAKIDSGKYKLVDLN